MDEPRACYTSEVSQKEKNILYSNTYIWNLERPTDEPICRAAIRDFSSGSEGKESACNAGELGSIPGLGRSPGEGNGTPFQCSCLENLMDRGVWQATVHRVTKSRAQPSNFTSLQWNVNIEKRLTNLGEGAGRKDGETHGESNMGTYTLLCNLDSQ